MLKLCTWKINQIYFLLHVMYCTQRVLNDLKRTRFSCSRMIRLHAHPLPPPLPSASCFSVSVFLCVAGWAYWWRGGERWVWSQTIRPRESLALYKSFNTLGLYIFHIPDGRQDSAWGQMTRQAARSTQPTFCLPTFWGWTSRISWGETTVSCYYHMGGGLLSHNGVEL